jgi:hypothetical protein
MYFADNISLLYKVIMTLALCKTDSLFIETINASKLLKKYDKILK